MAVKEFNLETRFDSRKSFYGKAVVKVQENGEKILQSYNTYVAKITADGIVEVYGTYSATTLRHIKEFLLQNGFSASSKKEIEELYLV